MSDKIRKYQHKANVLCGEEANRLMHRMLKLYMYADDIVLKKQHDVVMRHIAAVEHDFAMLGYMAREDRRELYVRSSEYKKLHHRRNA